MAIQYDDSSIQILEGLEPVRKRPGMYIGSTDSHGLHHMIWEIVDNAVDEAINGFGKKITIILENDGSVSVSDQEACHANEGQTSLTQRGERPFRALSQ